MLSIWIAFSVTMVAVFSIVMFATASDSKDSAMKRRFWEVLKVTSALTVKKSETIEMSPLVSAKLVDQRQLVIRNAAILDRLRKLVTQSHVQISINALLRLIMALACASFATTWYFSVAFPIASVTAISAATLPIAYLYHRRRKWLAAFNGVLPESIDTFSRSLKAGQSIVASFDIVARQAPAPANTVFADVFKKQRYGLQLREALSQMVEEVPSIDLKIMVTAILVQRETGGNLPNVLDRLSAVIRDRQRIRREIKSQTAQGRMTGWVLGLLPPLLMLAINWISPNYSRPLFSDPTGRYMLYAGVALLLIGLFVIQRMVQGIEV